MKYEEVPHKVIPNSDWQNLKENSLILRYLRSTIQKTHKVNFLYLYVMEQKIESFQVFIFRMN